MNQPAFTQMIDLAQARVGGSIVAVSDDFFAEAENMLKPGRGVFIADKYTDRGKWMDGWESRRKRVPGHDWCVVKLGLRGTIKGFDIDTNHFLGNHPPFASVEACCVTGIPKDGDWKEILAKSKLAPGSQNFFEVSSSDSYTHLRLNIYPDGGVARFKVYGEVRPDWDVLKNKTIDLVGVQHGGLVLTCNDMFFSSKDNLIMPGRGVNMGDGWETKRKREPGYDWVILQLGHAGTIKQIEVDTAHFKGNFPDQCSIDVIAAPGATADELKQSGKWRECLPKQKLQADHQHHFSENQLLVKDVITHVRLNIYPDGGISRLRIMGQPA